MSEEGTVTITMKADNPFGNDAHPSINVKWHGPWPDGDWPDADSDAVYEIVQMGWWSLASTLAHEHGYSGVFAEGRSGGWLQPFRQEERGTLQHYGWDWWPGQGPDYGYPTYPDIYDAEERKVFLAFREAVEKLLAEVPAMIREELDYQQSEADVRKALTDPLGALAATEEGA